MATGGKDVTLSSTSDKFKSLTCGLCLDVFRDPKLLSCSHTFCQRCLEDLIQRHTDGSFPCPSCRTDIEVPAGGASAFQTNFHISEDELERARVQTLCIVHIKMKLEMFCVECDILICMDCKMKEHLHHKTQSLEDSVKTAKIQLVKDKIRIQTSIKDLEIYREKRKTDQRQLKDKKAEVERRILQCHSTIVDEVDKYRNEALAALESACAGMEMTQSKDLVETQKKNAELCSLLQRLKQAEKEENSYEIVTVAKEMRSGRGSEEAVKKLLPGPLEYLRRPVHVADTQADESMFQQAKRFVGSIADIAITCASEKDVLVENKFKCA